MSYYIRKMTSFAILVVLGILLGIQLAGHRVETNQRVIDPIATPNVQTDVYHSRSGDAQTIIGEDPSPLSSTASKTQLVTPGQVLHASLDKPTVDVLADKMASLLQNVSQKSIRWIVSRFAKTE